MKHDLIHHMRAATLLYLCALTTGWAAAAPFDFDGDGNSDISVYYRDLGTWYIKNSGNNTVRTLNFGWSATVPVAGDYDGDGKVDIAVFHRATGNWYILQSQSGTVRFLNFGWWETAAVPADYDGDGKTDIAVYHRNTGNWYILQSQSGAVRLQNFGWFATRPEPADYDGDGKADVAVYYPETGTWYILQSQSGTIRTQVFGNSETKPVCGDFDGDGKADLAVYASATGNWSIFQSQSSTVRALNFGWNLAGAVPADYDGDGEADVAVYYPEAGSWYIQRSADLVVVLTTFGWVDARAVPAYGKGSVEGLRVLCLGDSITYGRGSTFNGPRSGYPALTDPKLDAANGGDFLFINVGAPGESTSGGRARLSAELNQHKPDVLCLMEGTNDTSDPNPVSFNTIDSNLRAMVNIAKARGILVVIATIPPVVPSSRPAQYARIRAFNPRIYAIASSLQIPLARVFEYITAVPGWETNLLDQSQTNHPNDAGYQRIRNAFFDALSGALNAGLIY